MKCNGWPQHSAFNETCSPKQLHTFRFLVRMAQGLGLALALNGMIVISAFAAEAMPVVEIRVINLSAATPATLARAEAEAGWILREAGLEVVWLNCPLEAAGGNRNPADACEQPLGPASAFVRVLPEQTRKGLQEDVFGFAVHPALASVYFGSAVDVAWAYRAQGMDLPAILGGVMTHEIGHLLLGSNSHSVTGIMQAHWGRKQLQDLLKRGLVFTKEQARQIRGEWQTRMMPEPGRTHATS